MSIPLVQEATKDAINTSIIAIKRNIERINMLLGLVDSGSPDLSGLATKQELEDAITQVEADLAPVDEVTSGNMQSVTSNSVAEALTLSDIDPLDGTGISGLTLSTANQVAPYNGFITIGYNFTSAYARSLYVNDVLVGGIGHPGGMGLYVAEGFTYPLRKGDTFRVNADCNLKSARWFIYQ